MEWLGRFVKEYGWLGTVIAAIATAIWAVTTYLQNAKREYVRDFNTKQVQSFFNTAETVAGLVAESSAGEWDKLRSTFWKLHYGDLVIFENPGIECAMTYFGVKLNATPFESRRELGPYAFAVSQELRKFIQQLNENEWKINLTNFAGVKNDLAPTLGSQGERTAADTSRTIKSDIEKKCKGIIPTPQDIAPSVN